jgi:hypothetical protein
MLNLKKIDHPVNTMSNVLTIISEVPLAIAIFANDYICIQLPKQNIDW